MVTVRPFVKEDAQRASEVLIAAFKSFLEDRFDEGCAAHFHPEVLVQGAHVEDPFMVSRIFVAEEDGDVLGVVKVTARTNGLGMFDYAGVDPNSHARGIGSLLMAKAEEFWAEHQQRKIDTCVSAHNKKAIMYYLKHDFIPEGYRKNHFLEGVDEIILGRFLKG
jgi:ribosomal protein S18 acetylase RimI-like enzyme